MIIKKLDEIELKKSRSSKKEMIENLEKIKNELATLKKDNLYSDKKEDEKKILEFYKMKKSSILLYHYNTKNYHYTIFEIDDNTSKLYFIIRDDELSGYFKNYFREKTIENITNLSNDKIIDKLNKFDFLIYDNMITLLHLKNDYEIKK